MGYCAPLQGGGAEKREQKEYEPVPNKERTPLEHRLRKYPFVSCYNINNINYLKKRFRYLDGFKGIGLQIRNQMIVQLGRVLWKLLEISLNVGMFMKIKYPVKPLSVHVGPALRKSLSIIHDRHFNYAFGSGTYVNFVD